MQQIFCDQELQTGTGKDKSCSAWHIKVGLSPFLLIKFYLILHFPSTIVSSNQLVISETSRSNRMMTAILNRLMLSDQEDGYLKNELPLVDCQTVTKYSAVFVPNFNKYFVEFMQ